MDELQRRLEQAFYDFPCTALKGWESTHGNMGIYSFPSRRVVLYLAFLSNDGALAWLPFPSMAFAGLMEVASVIALVSGAQEIGA